MLLQLRDISKSYRLRTETIPVLCGIDLDIAKGHYMAIVGPSGSGKSTLLNILGCLDSPSGGQYFLANQPIHGRSLNELAEIRNRSIGFIFQSFNLLPRLNLEQNVELPLIYASKSKEIRKRLVQEIMERLGIWERRKHLPHETSGGQKQRAAIARALVKRPDFILADEPTGNLDSAATANILELFADLHREGNTLVVITHDSEVAARASETVVIKDGFLSRPSAPPRRAPP